MKTLIPIKLNILAILQFAIVIPSLAQSPAIEWDKGFGSTKRDEMCTIIETNDGGFLLCGDSDSPVGGDKSQGTQGASDYWIVKADALGNKIWDKRFGGNSWDEMFAVLQTSDGGYLLGGGTTSGVSGDQTHTSRGGRDYWIVRTDENGNKLWDKRFGGPADDELYDMVQTSDGGFMLGGESLSGVGGEKTQVNHGAYDLWIVKTDAGGNLQWDASYGGTDDDRLNAIQVTPDGGYILGAWTISPVSFDVTQPGKGSTDMWLVKINNDGVKLWDGRYGGDDNEYLYALDQTGDGGFVLAGYTRSDVSDDVTVPGQGGYDFWIVKTNGSGVKQWDKRYGGLLDDKAKSIFETNDGGFIVGGWSASGIGGDKSEDTKGGTDYWLLKSDANGDKLWDMDLGALEEERLQDAQQTSDGGFVVSGHSNSGLDGDKTEASNGINDYWIVKLSGTGPSELFYADNDNDGFGNASMDTLAAEAPEGYVSDNTDCNDAIAAINPNAADLCNTIDDNCNGQADENALTAAISPTGIVEVCKGTDVILTANTGSAISYQWLKNGANINNANSATYITSKKGDYQVAESNNFNCSSTSAVTTIKTLSIPDAVITPLGDLDICAAGSVVLQANSGNNLTYQWQKDGSKILGATNQNYTAIEAAFYKVVVKKNNGCSEKSEVVKVTKSCKLSDDVEISLSESLVVYPNPTDGLFVISLKLNDLSCNMAVVQVINTIGQTVYDKNISVSNGQLADEIHLDTDAAGGMYLVKVVAGDKMYSGQMLYQK